MSKKRENACDEMTVRAKQEEIKRKKLHENRREGMREERKGEDR